MKKQLLKNDIHRKALRAAAGVALFGGSFACGEMPARELGRSYPNNSLEDAAQPVADSGSASTTDAGQLPPQDTGVAIDAGQVAPEDTGIAMDAGVTPEPDAGTPVDAGETPSMDASMSMDASTSTVSDAGYERCEMTDAGWAAYAKCCERYNWDPQRGCFAWGPPAPPKAATPTSEDNS